jgi:hypothetical protein
MAADRHTFSDTAVGAKPEFQFVAKSGLLKVTTMKVALCILLLTVSASVHAQMDVTFVFHADRVDSIAVRFNREGVFNESSLGDGYQVVHLTGANVTIRFQNVTQIARLSLGSYGWPGHFIATNWIVEPGDSVYVEIAFDQEPDPQVIFQGINSHKYQLAFNMRAWNDQIRGLEFETYDSLKTPEQALQEVSTKEAQFKKQLSENRIGLSESVYKTWMTDIQAAADLARLHIRNYQWTLNQERKTIRKELFATPPKFEPSLWATSRALVQYRYERIKWKVLQEQDADYRHYELNHSTKISLRQLFREIQKQPRLDQEFLMTYALVNPYTLRHHFGDTHPDILTECLMIADQTVKNPELRNILMETTQRLKPGVIVKDLITLTEKGDTLKLSDLRGKKIILDRWIADCTGCLEFKKEMIAEVLPKIKDRKDIVIWSVGSVRDFNKWLHLLPTNSHPDFVSGWLNRKDNSWESDYKISYAPFIMLIDEHGRLITSTVRNPKIILKLLGLQ